MENKEQIVQLTPSIPQSIVNVTAIYTAYAYTYSPHYTFNGERHEPYELVYVNMGEIMIQGNEKSYILTQGQLFIHPPYEYHKIKANNKMSSVQIMTFDCEGEGIKNITDKVISCSPYQTKIANQLIDESLIYFSHKKEDNTNTHYYGCGQMSKNLLEILLISLLRTQISPCALSQNNDDTLIVKEIKQYLKDNIYHKLTLSNISDAMGYSVSRLCGLFKQNTSMSIMNYFIKLRINKAKQLLAEKNLSINEICELMNFDSPQYFFSQFKKFTGMTPTQYTQHMHTNNWIMLSSPQDIK